jgi:hypothetical protein
LTLDVTLSRIRPERLPRLRNEGVDTGLADVARRIVESEIRTSTAIRT